MCCVEEESHDTSDAHMECAEILKQKVGANTGSWFAVCDIILTLTGVLSNLLRPPRHRKHGWIQGTL